jgi:hypothetical protein
VTPTVVGLRRAGLAALAAADCQRFWGVEGWPELAADDGVYGCAADFLRPQSRRTDTLWPSFNVVSTSPAATHPA